MGRVQIDQWKAAKSDAGGQLSAVRASFAGCVV